MKPNANTGASDDRDQTSKTSPDLDKNNQQAKSLAQGGQSNRSDMNAGKGASPNDARKTNSDNQSMKKGQNKNNPAAGLNEESEDNSNNENSSDQSGTQQSGTNAQGGATRSPGQSSSQDKNNPSDSRKEQRK